MNHGNQVDQSRIALLCDNTPCTCTSLQGGEAIMRPPRAPACFIPIFSRGAPSGQFLAPSTLIRILQGEDAASKLHRFRKPNEARLEKCVWFNWPNMSHISQTAYYPLPRFEQGKGAFIKDPEYRTNSGKTPPGLVGSVQIVSFGCVYLQNKQQRNLQIEISWVGRSTRRIPQVNQSSAISGCEHSLPAWRSSTNQALI